MDCPRCGLPAVAEPACPRCGVVFAKLASARPRPARTPPPPAPPPPSGGGGSGLAGTLLGVAAILAVGFFAIRTFGKAEPPPAAPAGAPAAASDVAPAGPLPELPPPALEAISLPPPAAVEVETARVDEADRARAQNLALRLASPSSLGQADVQEAEGLFLRHPEEAPVRNLLEAVLLGAASKEERQRRFHEAATYLRRAAEVQPASVRPHIALTQLFLGTGDWASAEASARAALALDPRSAGAWQALGFALFRQDRNREALDALKTALDLQDDGNTRALVARIEKGMADERGMADRQLAHFHVRYDGQEHEAVGREILRALERHYATLTSVLDHQPAAPIPVILFSREGYYNASGAPAWSGGVYDGLDGRIRIPIGGLTTSLTPDMDGTLIHELTHAFVADRTRQVAPRVIHEGLAQYNEGKRLTTMLPPEYVQALADGRLGGVAGFYLASLSFVEHLIAQRGMGGMNDLLQAMGETGNVDEAFRQVHGTTLQGSLQAWAQRFQRQHGS